MQSFKWQDSCLKLQANKKKPLDSFKYRVTEFNRMPPTYDKNEISTEFLRSPDTLQSLAAKVVDKLPLEGCYEWTNQDVRRWIYNLGYPMYRETFRVNDIRGPKLLLLDISALQAMNIRDFDHGKDIAANIRRLFSVEWAKFGRNLGLPRQGFLELYKLWHTKTRGVNNIRHTVLYRQMEILRPPPELQTHWDILERALRGENKRNAQESWGEVRRAVLYACNKEETKSDHQKESPCCKCNKPCECGRPQHMRSPRSLSCLVEKGLRRPVDPGFRLDCPKCVPPCDCNWSAEKFTVQGTLSCLQSGLPHKYGYPSYKKPSMGTEPVNRGKR